VKKLILTAALAVATPAWGQTDDAWRQRSMEAGQFAGYLIACAAPPEHVFRAWRLAEADLGLAPPLTEPFSMHYLAGLMVGMQKRVTPSDCTALLRLTRQLHGEAQ
jgi:hypothetical protein